MDKYKKRRVINRIFVFGIFSICTLCNIGCNDEQNDNNANNVRPACIEVTEKLQIIESDYMATEIIGQNQHRSFTLERVYWDDYSQKAFKEKCNVKLNYKTNSNSELTHVDKIETGNGSEEQLIQNLTDYHNACYNSLGGFHIIAIDDLSNRSALPDAAGLTHRNPNYSFVLSGYIIDNTSPETVEALKRLVTAHEIGHQFGISRDEHGVHGGLGNECCLMHSPVPYYNCNMTSVFFCNDHACALN